MGMNLLSLRHKNIAAVIIRDAERLAMPERDPERMTAKDIIATARLNNTLNLASFDLAIKKESNVRIFFRFADAKLFECPPPAEDCVIEHGAEIIFYGGVREDHGSLSGVGAKSGEIGLEFGRETLGELGGAVGAKVEEKHRIVFVNEPSGI